MFEDGTVNILEQVQTFVVLLQLNFEAELVCFLLLLGLNLSEQVLGRLSHGRLVVA